WRVLQVRLCQSRVAERVIALTSFGLFESSTIRMVGWLPVALPCTDVLMRHPPARLAYSVIGGSFATLTRSPQRFWNQSLWIKPRLLRASRFVRFASKLADMKRSVGSWIHTHTGKKTWTMRLFMHPGGMLITTKRISRR